MTPLTHLHMTMLAWRRPVLLAFLLTACAPRQAPDPAAGAGAAAAARDDAARWRQRAQAVTITRDSWGIAHVRGKSDADAVFGMIYAQAEDDFERIESNYLDALGRRAEAEGEAELWRDLRQKLFMDPDTLRAQWTTSPAWLRDVTTAWADGLNYYLSTHADVRPKVIARFEPWMALAFSEGSIGGDIESISLRELAAFYGRQQAGAARDAHLEEDRGSNGIAIAPRITAAGRPLLLINPHTSFFFRSELQMTSDEGLNAYGAATWGQFFLYQGFNDRLGWMHTSSGVDVIDEFLETTVERDGKHFYRYGSEERAVTVKAITVPYRAADGTMASRRFTTYRTHHGPVVREAGGRWVSVALMHKPVAALQQSYLRTKARTLAEYQRVMELHANSSNNTLYADADGNIAYFHPQFVPRRDDRFDYTRPVDGSNPEADWKGEHALGEMPSIVNPPVGWAFNSNNWPYTTSGPDSPKPSDFPRYMDTFGQNARGQHALRLLTGSRDWTPEKLRAAAYDSYMPGFATLVPVLLKAYDALPASDERRARLAQPIEVLRAWDFRWDTSSVATSVAVFWGERVGAIGSRSCARRASLAGSVSYALSRAGTSVAKPGMYES